jgi:phosphate starvation-inducible protein PhoH
LVSGIALAGRLLTLSVVAEAHSGLAEANGVLSSANSIELLEFGLVDTLQNTIVSDCFAARSKGAREPGWGSRAQWP